MILEAADHDAAVELAVTGEVVHGDGEQANQPSG